MNGEEYYSDDGGLQIQYGDFQDDENKNTEKTYLDSSSGDDFYVDDDNNNDDDYFEDDFDDTMEKSKIPSNENDDKHRKVYKNRPSLEYLEKEQQKQQIKEKSLKEFDEGSGNFSNNDDENQDEFFGSHRKTNYLRKNTNDAIKIISTPHGKVGIVYQKTPIENVSKSETINYNQQQKITPVLTPDGKVALLYRGASENTKYEPLLNLTFNQQFNTKQINDDNNTSATKLEISNLNIAKNYGIKNDYDTTTEDLGYDDDDDEIVKDIINPSLEIPSKLMEKATIIQTTHLRPHLEIEYENSILPNINRPLSEVLGIKKNQFKQFRIKDELTTTTTTTWLPPIFKDNNDNDDIILGDRNRGFISGSSNVYNNNNNNNNNKNILPNINNEYDDKNYDSNRPSDDAPNDEFMTNNEFISNSEVVNLAIIPHFDEEFELLQQQERYKEQYAAGAGNGLHYHHRYRYRHFNQDLTSVHCIMQALMGLAAISTVFGMLGAFFKQRVIDQFRTMHW